MYSLGNSATFTTPALSSLNPTPVTPSPPPPPLSSESARRR
jgi:hypothetical protein